MPLKPSRKLGGFFVSNFYEKLIKNIRFKSFYNGDLAMTINIKPLDGSEVIPILVTPQRRKGL
jgi:hypothetical protein